MSPTVLYGTIYRSHCILSTNFYLCLQYFQQKIFNFSKINRFQTNMKNLPNAAGEVANNITVIV